MSPSPKSPEEEKHPNDEYSSNEELAHPQIHFEHEHIASSDESTADSDDENNDRQYNDFNGYCLLSQGSDFNPQQEQHHSSNEDDEFLRFATLRMQSSIDEIKIQPVVNSTANTFESVWTSKCNGESFPVDDDKADYIKQRMSSITLPESSIPIWAQFCSEQDWQAKLQEKILCRQTTFFLNEKH